MGAATMGLHGLAWASWLHFVAPEIPTSGLLFNVAACGVTGVEPACC